MLVSVDLLYKLLVSRVLPNSLFYYILFVAGVKGKDNKTFLFCICCASLLVNHNEKKNGIPDQFIEQ